MTARAVVVAELIRTALAAADQLGTVERAEIYAMLVVDLRSRWPGAVSLLGGPPPPTSPIVDPRGPR